MLLFRSFPLVVQHTGMFSLAQFMPNRSLMNTNIGNIFFKLLNKQFPRGHKFSKLFNLDRQIKLRTKD